MLLGGSVVLGTAVLVSGPGVLFALACLFAVGLSIARVKLRIEQDPRLEQLETALPGANCGGCGYPGCAALAQAIVEGKVPVTACPVGGLPCAEAVAKILGVTFEVTVTTRPVVHCTARADQRGQKPYHGVPRCSEGNLIAGIQPCAYGCLAFGDCVDACKFDALRMEDGLPVFDYGKCTSCGACVRACPRDLIELIPFKNESMLVVGCSSRDPARVVRQICPVGCLGCGACAKKSDVFALDRNLTRIDYNKYEDVKSLKAVFEKCPAAALVIFGPTGRIPVKEAYAQPVAATAETT